MGAEIVFNSCATCWTLQTVDSTHSGIETRGTVITFSVIYVGLLPRSTLLDTNKKRTAHQEKSMKLLLPIIFTVTNFLSDDEFCLSHFVNYDLIRKTGFANRIDGAFLTLQDPFWRILSCRA